MTNLFAFLKELNPAVNIKDDSDFIISKKEIISFKSLNHKSISFANKLKDNGIMSQDRIPILLENSPNFIIAVLSLWMIEAIPVPMNLKLSLVEIEEQLKFLKSKFALIDEPFTGKMMLTDVKPIIIPVLCEDFEMIAMDFGFDESKTAVIIFTSGSSDRPKAAELTFSSLIKSALIGNKFLNQTNNDRWLASLPFYHIGGFSIIFRALMYGTAIAIPDYLKIDSIVQSLNNSNPSLISFVSSQMSDLLKNNIQPNDLQHCVLLGGGFIDTNLMQEALNEGWKVCKVYGSTETSSFVTVLSPEEFKKKPDSAGKPIPPNEIFIFDNDGNKLPPNTEGEIVVKSPALMKGYFNDKELTKQKLKDGLYFTGDIGYKDEDGFLYIVSKRSDLIVTGGENVNPLEVEAVIIQYSKVKEVCVFGLDDTKWGQKVVAAIATKSNAKFSLDELKAFLGNKIASFKIPKEVYFVDELPKTELGKIKRDGVKKLYI